MTANICLQRLAQGFMQRVNPRVNPRIMQHLWVFGVVAFAALASVASIAMTATTVHGQTLFARPDTKSDYAAYRHFEDCLALIYRVEHVQLNKGNTFWADTATLAQWKQWEKETGFIGWYLQRPRTDSAIQAGRACLSRFNMDTVPIKSVKQGTNLVKTLLLVNRDQDAQRVTQRLLDSMRLRSARDYSDALYNVLYTYIFTGPVWFPAANQYYTQLLAALKGDSLYRTIDAHLLFSVAAKAINDTTLEMDVLMRAIRVNDSTPVEERVRSFGSTKRLNMRRYAVAWHTRDEGLDSLAISTLAYNLYVTNTVMRRVYGGEIAVATDEKVQPYKVPDLLGKYSYAATTGAPLKQGLAPYARQDALPPGTLPVKNKINFITSIPSFCHGESPVRYDDDAVKRKQCWRVSTELRRLKEEYPNIEIIVLTNTYGHVGQLGPLQPADEADTLAKLLLGHHRMPGYLVVDTTAFFNMENPDGRRIDLPTAQMEALGTEREWFKVDWYTDREGYRVDAMSVPGWFDRAYEILMKRSRK